MPALLGALPAPAHADTLARLHAGGHVTLGVRDASGVLSYRLPDGSHTGFHVALCELLLQQVRERHGLPALQVRQRVLTSQNRVLMLQSGQVDLDCGSTSNTPERQRELAFAHTSYVEQVRIAVRAGSGITMLAQLANRPVVTTSGATAVQHLRAFRRATGIELREVFGRDHADSFRLLASGRADAFVMDAQILASLIARAPDPAAFEIVGEALATEPIAIAMRRDDVAWHAAINAELAALMADGRVAALYERWFMQPVPPDGVRLGLSASAGTRAAWARPGPVSAGDPPAQADGRQRRPPPPDPVTTR